MDDPDPEEKDDWVVSMSDDRAKDAVCDELFGECHNSWSQDLGEWRGSRFDGIESLAAVSLRQPSVTKIRQAEARHSQAMLIPNARRERVGQRPLLCRSSVVWLAACLMLGTFCFGWAAWSSSAPDRPTARAASTTISAAASPVTYVTKTMEDVRKGETVVAWDPVTGQLGRHEVTNTFARTSDHLRIVEFAADGDGQTQTLRTTDEHPFWSVGVGDFVAAADLRIGDRFISPAGEFSTLIATHREQHPDGVAVYNFEVSGVHNYYVRAHGLRAPPLRVHNASGNTCGVAPKGGLDWIVGRHGDMPSPRPAGYQSHQGVNSVWMESNVGRYAAGDAPAVLMRNAPNHNATRGVFNRIRSEIAARQGLSPRDVDWSQVSPGTAWRLAEEQFQAAQVPANIRAKYFRQFNKYLESLR